jgi:AcrR family transcriptional regulator
MKHRSDRDGRQKILEVAERLFTEQGYNAVSIRDIAERCEVTNAALYYHFSSKAALFGEVVEHHARRIDAQMRIAADQEGTYREKVATMLLEYAHMIKDRRPPFHLLHHHIEGVDKDTKLEHMRRLFYATILPIQELLQEATEAGELTALPHEYSSAALLVGMMNGQIQFHHACGKDAVGFDEVKSIVDIFWDGLSIAKHT